MAAILLRGSFPTEVLETLRAINGEAYPLDQRQRIFDGMASGLFFANEGVDADNVISNDGAVGAESVPAGPNWTHVIRETRAAQNRILTKNRRLGRAEFAESLRIDPKVANLITKPEDLPVIRKFEGINFEDWTPFCFFANPIVQFRDSPINVFKFVTEHVEREGEIVELPGFEQDVTRYAHDRWDELSRTGVEEKMRYSGHKMRETGVAFLLPPSHFVGADGKRNTTGSEAILFGTDLFKKFTTALVNARLRRFNKVRNEDDAIKHAIWMRQDYSSWPSHVQEVFHDSTYHVELNSEERQLLEVFCGYSREYLSFIERNAIAMFKAKPSDFSMDMKPLKSPGTDSILPSGDVFNKRESILYPHESFVTPVPERNAYASQSYFPLKKQLVPFIIPSVKTRLAGLSKGLLHNPEWEFEMVMAGCAREGTVAWRINNPDKCSVYRDDGSSEPVDPAKVPGSWDSPDWVRYQGKPREATVQVSPGVFKTAFLSPFTLAKHITECAEGAYNENESKNSPLGLRQTRYDKAGMLLRARIIMPHKWRFNMFDGTIAKLFAGPLEHNRCGFPNLKVGSPYEQLYRSSVSKTAVVPWAFDVSHYETFASSNREMILSMFGDEGSKRRLFFEDAASGWLAGAFGRRYHGFQTSSGIGMTTFFSVLPGTFLVGVDVAYRNSNQKDYMATAKAVWTKLFWEACEYARHTYNIDAKNPFGDECPDFPTYSWMGKCVESLVSFGSDDQGGWDQSDDASIADIEAALSNDRLADWRKRARCEGETGEGSHFGIVRTSVGFQEDETSSDWKWCFCERKGVGDLIALGATVAFQKTPGLEEDVQEALDAIGGGSTEAYWLGARVAGAILHQCPEFCSEVLNSNYPIESPSGARMSEMLRESGFNVGASNKLPEDISHEIISTYLEFIGGNQ